MQVNETLNDGLKRKLSVTIPSSHLNEKLDAKLQQLKSQANLKGFRPGKVPMTHLKKTYGRSAMSEVMQEEINSTVQETLSGREERAAMQPKIDLPEDQSTINKVLDGEADLAFEVSYEVLPPVKLMDFKKIKVTRPVVETTDEEVDAELQRVFRNNRKYEDKGDGGVVAEGDRLGLTFEGKINGKPFEGGKSDHAHLIVGSGEFIPGFEEQLVGMKKDENRQIKVTFPKDYGNEELAGKEATFDVKVLHIDGPDDSKLDDEFAKKLGVDDVAALRTAVKDQMELTLRNMSQQNVKRQVLDAMDEGHKFDIPSELVDAEFNSIWHQVQHEIEQHGKTFEDEGTTEEEARAQYRTISERRVRLGLVVAEIGNKNKIEVTEEEHQQALLAEVRRFPGQEQQVYDYYIKNKQALAGLRAPVYENKVVTFVIELADVTDKKMDRKALAELISDDNDEGPISSSHSHDHDHDHEGHDHEGHDHHDH